MRNLQIALVQWTDAVHRDGHFEEDARRGYTQISVGFLLESNKDFVVLAQSCSGEADDDRAMDTLEIPRPLVRRIWRIGRKSKKQ